MPTQSGCTLCGGNDHARSECSWSGAPDEREVFEAFYLREIAGAQESLLKDGNGHYVVDTTMDVWAGWQARAAWQRAQAAPEGHVLAPFSPTDEQWGGLARDIVWWMRSYPSNKHTPSTLMEHLNNLGREIPAWMGDESELRAQDHVISKGTIAVLIYKAMLAAAPQPAVRDWPDDEIVSAWKWCEENGGTPAEFLSHSLLVKRSRVLGRPLTWREAIELTAMTTNMPDEERDKLLAIDDEPEPAQHAHADEVRRLREALEWISDNGFGDNGSECVDMARAALSAQGVGERT